MAQKPVHFPVRALHEILVMFSNVLIAILFFVHAVYLIFMVLWYYYFELISTLTLAAVHMYGTLLHVHYYIHLPAFFWLCEFPGTRFCNKCIKSNGSHASGRTTGKEFTVPRNFCLQGAFGHGTSVAGRHAFSCSQSVLLFLHSPQPRPLRRARCRSNHGHGAALQRWGKQGRAEQGSPAQPLRPGRSEKRRVGVTSCSGSAPCSLNLAY